MTPPAPTCVPPLAAGCRLTVVMPARDESRSIGAALAALNRQRDFRGRALAPDLFDVIVFANNCRDRTAALARAFASGSRHCVHVVERDFAAPHAHIGTARKYVMDLAAARFLAAGRPNGLVASTDCDTIVDDHWIHATLAEGAGVDAVAGCVRLAPSEQERLLAPVRLLYARELTYRRLVAEVEAVLDPVPEDPLPRHNSFVGASFAVRAATYRAAGGLPPLPCLEDQNFCRALRRVDARIRHSTAVRASTSGRVRARVAGGFGTFMSDLHAQASRGQTFFVEDPQFTIDTFAQRAALRRFWLANGAPPRGTLDPSFDALLAAARPMLEQSTTFGQFHAIVTAQNGPATRRDVRVESAIDVLRAAAQPHLAGPALSGERVSSLA